MKALLRALGYPSAFAAGVFAFWFIQGIMATIPKPERNYIRPVTVESLDILPEHKWLLNYQVSFSDLDVDSRRQYLIIFLTPLESFRQEDLNLSEVSSFELTGFSETGSSLMFNLKMEKIRESANSQFIELKDFIGVSFGWKSIYFSSPLELKSQEFRVYPPVSSDRLNYKFEGKRWHLK